MSTLFTLINYTALALLALAFIGIAFFCLLLIMRNVKQGQVFRQALAKRIEASRVNSALKLFNIEFGEYLHNAPVTKIVENIDHCNECVSPWCEDDSKSHPSVREVKFHFCPIANHFIDKAKSER